MAVIKCSLKDGHLHVEEVLEFQKGDTIMVERSAHAAVVEIDGEVANIIPCPSIQGGKIGRSDCWTLTRPIRGRTIAVKG